MYTKLTHTCMFHGLSIGLFLMFICFSTLAQANDQGDRTITLSGSNISLKKVFSIIKQQTGIMVMYSQGVTKINQEEKVSVDFKDTPVREVLEFLFIGRGLDWTFNEDIVVIHKKKEKNLSPVDEKKRSRR